MTGTKWNEIREERLTNKQLCKLLNNVEYFDEIYNRRCLTWFVKLLFWRMVQTNPQAIDYSYPITNTPPLTTHHALIVCEAVRCVCPCGNDRDAKEDDCDDISTSDQFGWNQLRNAAILVLRIQKPSTNALDGLYFPWVDRMLEACRVEGCAESMPRRACVWRKRRRF